ncbi:uncharacterized protein [Emydura macquarii macquarii]|uniref:uncharacterized protein n=1 Tax=Emydura macquarii macquarii TaxID=1129001 RepID=UPI00352A7A85
MAHTDDVKEAFCEQLDRERKDVLRNEKLIIMGDFGARRRLTTFFRRLTSREHRHVRKVFVQPAAVDACSDLSHQEQALAEKLERRKCSWMIPSCMKRLCVCGKSSNTKSNADGDRAVSSQRSWNCFSRKKRKRITTAKTAQPEEKKIEENAHQEELEHIESEISFRTLQCLGDENVSSEEQDAANSLCVTAETKPSRVLETTWDSLQGHHQIPGDHLSSAQLKDLLRTALKGLTASDQGRFKGAEEVLSAIVSIQGARMDRVRDSRSGEGGWALGHISRTSWEWRNSETEERLLQGRSWGQARRSS